MSVRIETSRLILREYTDGDLDMLTAIFTDAEMMKFYPHTFDREKTSLWIWRNIERYADFGFGLWAVESKEDGALLGDCGISMQRQGRVILPEIAYHIRRDRQNNGYAAEAGRAVLGWVSENTPFKRIYANVNAENTASLRTAEKLGMKECSRGELNGEKMILLSVDIRK